MSLYAQQFQEGLIRGKYMSYMNWWQKILCRYGFHNRKVKIDKEARDTGVIDTFSSSIITRCIWCGEPKWIDNPHKESIENYIDD